MTKNRLSIKYKISDKKYMAPLIGNKGCNIRRIVSEVGNGTFIKGENDGLTFTISSYCKRSLEQAVKLIEQDYKFLVNPEKNIYSKPTEIIMINKNLIQFVIGKNGVILKKIMDKVGDGCYILYKENKLYIYANSQLDLNHAKKLIKIEIKKASIISKKITSETIYVNYQENPKENVKKGLAKYMGVDKSQICDKFLDNVMIKNNQDDTHENIELRITKIEDNSNEKKNKHIKKINWYVSSDSSDSDTNEKLKKNDLFEFSDDLYSSDEDDLC